MRIHKKYGLNPSMTCCWWCFGDGDEIILFGESSKKMTGHDEAPRQVMGDRSMPCRKCKALMEDKGCIFLYQATEADDQTGESRTGTVLGVTDDWIKRNISPPELRDHILKTKFCFVMLDDWKAMGLDDAMKQHENKESAV